MKPNLERRAFAVDEVAIVRSKEKPVIAGHAAVFNQEADLGWFREKILPGAFLDSIAKDDIRALFNHDPNFVLGRNLNGTLRLREDDRGLFIENDPPDTQWARDLLTSIERRDISQMSFGFEVVDQRWETTDGVEVRIIERAKLWDVSPVAFPAYPQTDVDVRSSAQRVFEEHRKEQPSAAPAPGGGVQSLEPYYARLERAQKA